MTGTDTFLPTLLLSVLSALGLLGGIGLGIKAVLERRSLNATAKATQSKAGNDDATAASIVAQAARELIDPLRKELANERKENADELQRERQRVRELQTELNKVSEEVRTLHRTLRRAMKEIDNVKQKLAEKDNEIIKYEQQILEYEREIIRLTEYRNVVHKSEQLDSDPDTP